MSRRLSWMPFAAILGCALGGCGADAPQPQPPSRPSQPSPPPSAASIEDRIFPHVSAQMPAEGLDPDGRVAPWSLGAQFGATLHALAEACGSHDAGELQRVRDGQRVAAQDEGVDAERFDAVWTWAYRQARQKITMQPSVELERGCASLRQMQEDAGRMQGMMQPMALP